MKLENSFTVPADLERTWKTLLDIERVATCLPGAKIEAGAEDGVYRGTIRVRLGPMTVDYRGTARLQDVDEDSRTASIAVQARESKGQGAATAVIRNHLQSQNGGTKVVSVTDLSITGRQAQFGRGMMQDVAGAMMAEFADRLEDELGRPGGETDRQPTGESERPAGTTMRADGVPQAEEAFDLGGALVGARIVRYLPAAAAVLMIAFAIAVVLRGRRRQLTLNINLSR